MNYNLAIDIKQIYQLNIFDSIACICNENNIFFRTIINIGLPIKILYLNTPYYHDILNCTHIFIDTQNLENNTSIFNILINIKPSFTFITSKNIEFNNKKYLGLFISPEYLIVSKIPDFFPGILSYININMYTYSFNSSCISISKEGALFSNIHLSTNNIIYSVRTSHSKIDHSALIFCDSDGNLISKIYSYNDDSPIVREDLRLFVWRNELYGSYTYINPYIAGVKTYNNLTVGKFSYSENKIELVSEIIPQYGGNLNNNTEKNWSWWESPEGNLHCVYWFNPFTILSFSSLDKPPIEITNIHDKQLLKGHVRGGACGVVWDNKIWFFTHTSTVNSGCIGIVVLSYEETPRILGWNHDLVRSSDFSNVIIYTCGAIFKPEMNSWHLSGGIQDTKCFTLEIPYDYVYSNINWVG
jgi:hypothetical protein